MHPAQVVVDLPADPHATNVWAAAERQTLRIPKESADAVGRLLRCRVSRESATIPPHESPSLFVNVYVNWYACATELCSSRDSATGLLTTPGDPWSPSSTPTGSSPAQDRQPG